MTRHIGMPPFLRHDPRIWSGRDMRRRVFILASLGSLGLSIAMGVAWLRSYWRFDDIAWTRGHWVVDIIAQYGEIGIAQDWAPSGPQWDLGTHWSHKVYPPMRELMPNTLCCGFGITTVGLLGPSRQVWIPYWALTVAFGMSPACWILARLRRARRGMCHECGYNLTGNVSGICPECGKPVREAPPRQ